VIARPGVTVPCTIAPNVDGGPMNLSMQGDGQDMTQIVALLSITTAAGMSPRQLSSYVTAES
jgi:hypothetical protein